MIEENRPFEDPRLKSAVKRCWGAECAPADLRGRVHAACAARGRAAARRFVLSPMGLAMAAMVLVGVCALSVYLMSVSGGNAALAETPLPAQAVQDILKTHDYCTAKSDHHGLKGDNMAQLGPLLAAKVNMTVVCTSLDGWNFCGAGACHVGGHVTAHLVYHRGNQALSIFSIPSSDYQMPASESHYTTTDAQHEIAAFTHGGGFYCVVGSSSDNSLTTQQIQALRNQIETQFKSDSTPVPAAPVADIPLDDDEQACGTGTIIGP